MRLAGRTSIKGDFVRYGRSFGCPSDWPIPECYAPVVSVTASDGLRSARL